MLRVAASDTAENEAQLDGAVRGRRDPAARGDPVPARRCLPAPRRDADPRDRSRRATTTSSRGRCGSGRGPSRRASCRSPRAQDTGGDGIAARAVGRALRPGRRLHAQPGRHRPRRAVDRVARRRHARRPPAHRRALAPGRRRLRDGARPDRGHGHRRQPRVLGARVGARATRPTAYQWSPLARGRASVADGTLAEWSPLPPDGVYTLRLTARDKVELTASTRVDGDRRHDAAGPAHRPRGEGHEGARGLRPRRRDLEPEHRARPRRLPHRARRREDVERRPPRQPGVGRRRAARGPLHVLGSLAEDKAGQREPAGDARGARRPHAAPRLVLRPGGGRLGRRGRRRAGHGLERRRLRRVPAVRRRGRGAGRLDAAAPLVGAGRRRGRSASGWRSRTGRTSSRSRPRTRTATAPASRAAWSSTRCRPSRPCSSRSPRRRTPADRLVPSWQPSPSADVVGNLVYRNGRLANAGGGRARRPRGFLVPGTSYQDDGLPDGEHCYRVVADGRRPATSPCRRTRSASRSTTARRAPIIVHPPDGTRFGYPVRVVAETPDLDVASRPLRAGGRPGAPTGCGFGERAIRAAVGDDARPRAAGRPGARPRTVRAARRGDRPHRPHRSRPGRDHRRLRRHDAAAGARRPRRARRRGGRRRSTWTPVDAPDLASYRALPRRRADRRGPDRADATSIPGSLSARTSTSSPRSTATGTRAPPSAPAEAIVYAVRLEEPAWPVVSTSAALGERRRLAPRDDGGDPSRGRGDRGRTAATGGRLPRRRRAARSRTGTCSRPAGRTRPATAASPPTRSS